MILSTRIARLLELTALLQSGWSYTLDGFADELGVSRRTVFRDLRSLKDAGVPIEFDRDGGVYWLAEGQNGSGFRLLGGGRGQRRLNLNVEELSALVQCVQKARDSVVKQRALLAVTKLLTGAPPQIRQKAMAMAGAESLDST